MKIYSFGDVAYYVKNEIEAITGKYTGRSGNLTTRIGKPIDIKDLDLESANQLLRKNILDLMHKSEK